MYSTMPVEIRQHSFHSIQSNVLFYDIIIAKRAVSFCAYQLFYIEQLENVLVLDWLLVNNVTETVIKVSFIFL
jgi:purine-nucleoside phosphorylase